MDFKDIKQLRKKNVRKGERWIYSAGFNVGPDLKSTERIDVEVKDIKYIIQAGGAVSILSHQGSFSNKNTIHLDFLASYLSKKLNTTVKYFPENNSPDTIEFAKSLKPGEIAILGNTRFNQGEEENDSELARQFAKLGEFAAIGGFSKAHRNNASNVGILDYLPGYITKGFLEEMVLLYPWVGKKQDTYSIAILGGIKKEKITIGLRCFVDIYDFVIPGGIVLNTILKTTGYKIGKSVIRDNGETFEKEVYNVLSGKNRHKVWIPHKVTIAKKTGKGFHDRKTIDISEEFNKDYMIVDYVLDDSIKEIFKKVIADNGRIILAGTPTLYSEGFKNATNQFLDYLERPDLKSIVLGGDSVSEIPFKGIKSSGGGSALKFICEGTTAVYEALKRNTRKWN